MTNKYIFTLLTIVFFSSTIFAQNYIMSNNSVEECTGAITDSGATSNYGDNEDNTFTIVIPSGAVDLSLTFTEWDVEAGYDFLHIYDGADINANLVGTFSETTPGTINATNGALTLRFVSDGSVNEAGWVADWTSIGRSCGGSDTPNTTFIHECTGTSEDNGGSSANYNDNEDYTVVITPGAFIINMEFTEWDVEAGYDFLYIYDGADAVSPLIGTYSADSPGAITATSGSITLRFVSDESVNGAGWKATWTAGGGACSGPIAAPVTNFTTDNATTTLLEGQSLQFLDQTQGNPTAWSWTFEGANTATSSYQNPMVTYNEAGTYNVTLTTTNAGGSHTETKTAFITVEEASTSGYPQYVMSNTTALSCLGTLTDSGNETNYSNDEDYTFVIAPQGVANLELTFNFWDLEANYDIMYIYDGTDVNAPLIGEYSATNPGTITATSNAITIRFVSDYSVNQGGWSADWTSMGRGCNGGTSTAKLNQVEAKGLSIFPNPVIDVMNIRLETEIAEDVQFTLLDVSGRVIMTMVETVEGKAVVPFDMTDMETGVYFISISSPSYKSTEKIIKQDL